MPKKATDAKKAAEEVQDEPNEQSDAEEESNEKITLNLDSKAEQALLTAMRGQSSAGAVQFVFQREYYSVHGETARYIALEYYKTTSVLKYMGSGPAGPRGGARGVQTKAPSAAAQGEVYVAVSKAMFETIVRDLLLNKNRAVELWDQRAGSNSWFCKKTASPGDVHSFEDIIFKNTDLEESPIICAVRLANDGANRVVGVGYADTILKVLGVAEFNDTEHFSNLESCLIQLGARECILCQKDCTAMELEKIQDVLKRCNVVAADRPKADFAGKDLEQDLKRLVGEDNYHTIAETTHKHAMSAVSCLIKSLELMADDSSHGHFRMTSLRLEKFMRLDSAAVRALNLLPAPGDANKNMCLYGILNKCKTPMGSRMLMTWLKQPLLDAEEIRRRHDVVQVFYDDPVFRQSLLESVVRRVPDLGRMAKKFQRGKGGIQDIVRLYEFVVWVLPNMVEHLRGYTGAGAELLHSRYADRLQESIDNFEQFVAMVETSVDLDAVKDHEYNISAKWDPKLEEIKKRKEKLRRQIYESMPNEVADDLGIDAKKVSIEHTDSQGYHLRVPKTCQKSITGNPSYHQIQALKAGIKFTSKKMKGLSTEYTAACAEYSEKQASLVARAVEIAASYVPVMEECTALVSELDVLLAFAVVAASAATPYVRPAVTGLGEGGAVDLVACRHPVMEALDDMGRGFIPNDVRLVPGESTFQIVTGPNMGGKSTYIRMAGVVVLMAQVGSFVPCERAEVSVRDCILARVGAGDSQLRGVSTFMSEMLETAAILKTATDRSLVIVDELGRGTSTYDGFGLAWAISEHLVQEVRAMCLFATHFHELTALEGTLPGVVNYHVTAHTENNTLTMLYRVRKGPCDQSFGIHVAELVHFPDSVIQLAKRKARELETFEAAAQPEAPHAEATPSKRRRREELSADEKAAGRGAMERFVRGLLALGAEAGALSDDDLLRTVSKLKAEVDREAAGNAYVRDVLALA
eukprot:tig00001224_g7630.t1